MRRDALPRALRCSPKLWRMVHLERLFLSITERHRLHCSRKDTSYIAQALADLEKAEKEIDLYKSHLARILTYIKLSRQDPTAEGRDLLTTQFQVKCVTVDLLKMNIQDAVKKLKRAESRGGNVSLTEELTIFLTVGFIITPLRLLKELPMELMHMKSLGLDNFHFGHHLFF